MNRKKILFTAFILMAIIQLAIPGKMIWDKEQILKTGKEFKFETAPVDPTDPFRGKYIVLQYNENTIDLETEDNWVPGEKIYVVLKPDEKGFSTIDNVSKEKPTENLDYVLAKVNYVSGNRFKTINISYPFDRFYMEESKAYPAELEYRKSQQDSSKTTYALVSIKNGDAVLKDVLIDGVSIGEIVKQNQSE
ncbi:MAG: GDYXXLXY domain-containing protein [Aequorivita sp.]